MRLLRSTVLLPALVIPALVLAQAPAPPTAATPPPGSTGQEVVLTLAGNQRPLLRLAFPSFAPFSGTPAMATAATTIEATLRSDLDDSGVFQVQGPTELSVVTLSGDFAKDADQYRGLGNEVLLNAEVKTEGPRVVLEGRLVDLASRQTILGKRYAGDPDWARRIAHTFADEIVRHFTGQPGLGLTSIAFTSDRGGAKEIYLMDADGHGQRAISNHRSISLSPSWRPNGETLAYVSYIDGPPALYLADIASGRKRPLVTEGTLNISPSFSPDGTQVTFGRSLRGNVEVFVANADGGNLRQVTFSPGIDTNPAWSPDGRSIAFTSNRGGSPQIYVMDVEGTNLRRVTFSGDYNDGASWHPRQPLLAFSTRQGNSFNLATVDLVALESKVITTGEGSKESPSFSPDGRKLVFSWRRGPKADIYMVDLASGRVRQLTDAGSNSDPAWSPYLR